MATPKLAFFLAFLPLLAVASAHSAPANVLLDRGRTEPIVVTDPGHPSTVIVGANPNYGAAANGGYPMPFFTSHDGGRTFQRGTVPLRDPYRVATDPTLAIAGSGTIFYGFAAEQPGTSECANCKCTETQRPHDVILMSRSTNGGRSFRAPAVIDSNDSADRPTLAVESPAHHRAHVFVSWTRSQNDVWFARSTDGGLHFSAPVQLYRSAYGDSPSLPVVQSPGHVAVFWIETGGEDFASPTSARILDETSTDDGNHFGPMQVVVPWFKTMPRQVQPGNLRTPPSFAAAGSGGTLYLTWPAVRNVHGDGSVTADIDLTWSRDGGATWHAPVAVNNVHLEDRFMPAMTPLRDGSLAVTFYDRRAGANNLSVYAVHLTIQGGYRRSTNIPLSRHYANIAFIHQIPQSNACGSVSPGRFFGDYMGASANGSGTVRAVWADSGLGVADETDVWLAQVHLPALPAARSLQSRWYLSSRMR
ncbi:MAG TPA: sialidase family protein [Chloroflexota bacterium]